MHRSRRCHTGDRAVCRCSVACAARAQMPAGFELTLVDLDGTKKVLGQLPPTVYAPRVSPDGTRVAFETRDLTGPDGPRLWTARLSEHRRTTAAPAGRRPHQLGADVDARRRTPGVHRVRRARDAVYWRRADGTGDAEHLIDTRAAEGWNAGGSQMRFLTLTGEQRLRDLAARHGVPEGHAARRLARLGAAQQQHVARRQVDGVCVQRDRPLRGVDRAVPAHRRALPGDPRRRLASAVGAGWPIPLLRSRPSDVPARA